ncbi:related to serine/threonine protein kinase [Rhynchosporium secalis]|uniref:Related to serine/threonine protein kinase n=1 Tax=Rhynchosporium secalis TaxID=38038 RepID=A0A1E1M5L3_RHYSE|nr:related to serine/threonine protein kinase [Rhynchosporium secalis]
MSSSLFRLGRVLRGKNQTGESVVIKGVQGHPRVENERDVLKRFQDRTPYLRPLNDEVEEPSDPPTIVLKYLDDHLLNASIEKTLNRQELKFISRRILEALKVLHDETYVHTDVKLDNVLVNYRDGDIRFSDVQLGDLGGAYPADSKFAQEGTPVGAPMWTSPEVIMETPWNSATDIWSFGTVVPYKSHLWRKFNLFRPRTVSVDHEEYGLEVLKQQFRYFGPFSAKYEEIASPQTIAAILYLMEEIPQSKTTPFHRTTAKEVCTEDKEFIGKIMMLDWRDRPTAAELLKDEWLKEDSKEE